VAISESIDAAQITKNMYFITAGFKACDADAVDPVSKQPLCIDGLYSNVQSQNNAFPTQIMIAQETKESYEAFKSFFDFFAMASDKTISRDGMPHFWEALDGFQEIKLTDTIDMSAQWKGLQKGGACKQSRFFAIVAQLNLNMFIVSMILNAVAFVQTDWTKIGFVTITILQQTKQLRI
jgi:hypothetical protein